MKPEDKIRKYKEKYSERLKKTTKLVTQQAGQFAFDLLIIRTKSGFGTNGILDDLSINYVEFRKRWSAFLADDTSPETSNLTATGQLLDALFLRVVANKFLIKVNTKKRQEGLGGEALEEVKKATYTGKGENRKKTGEKVTGFQSKLTNDQVRKFSEDAGRVFLEFNEQEKQKVRQFAKELFKEYLSDIITN
jgi:hypothetical protein